MHTGHASQQLSSGKNHTATAEDIVDQVEQDEEPMYICAVAHAHELKRRMGVRDTEFCNNAQHGHESDLERKTTCPPNGQGDAPFVCVGGREDAFVDPHPGQSQFPVARNSELVQTHQLEKTAEAVRPVPTERLATMNISDWFESSERYLFWIRTAPIMIRQKSMERPMTSPYPVPWERSCGPSETAPIVGNQIYKCAKDQKQESVR